MLPGGGMKSGELPNEAAVRETLEETGLQINNLRLVGVYGRPGENDIVFSFLGEVIGGDITTTEEADRVAYFTVDKIPPNTSPRQLERIHDALLLHSNPYFRRQIGPSSRAWVRMLKRRKKKKRGLKKTRKT